MNPLSYSSLEPVRVSPHRGADVSVVFPVLLGPLPAAFVVTQLGQVLGRYWPVLQAVQELWSQCELVAELFQRASRPVPILLRFLLGSGGTAAVVRRVCPGRLLSTPILPGPFWEGREKARLCAPVEHKRCIVGMPYWRPQSSVLRLLGPSLRRRWWQ